jgi:ferric-dicitrate binding protein FerR (iron transport regulator)
MQMTQPAEYEANIAREAARWAEILRDEESASEADRRAFVAWVVRSPAHIRHFLVATALDDEASKDVEPAQACTLNELIDITCRPALSCHDAGGASAALERPTPPAPKRRLWAALAATFLVGLPLAALWQWTSNPTWNTYDTTVSHPQPFELEDGSLLSMSPQSLAKVHFSRKLREVRFLRGNADFSVQTDLTRPFRVNTKIGTIEAIVSPQSLAQVRLSPELREVRWLHGGADFNAERDPTRAFRVNTKTDTFEAVGTRFDVSLVDGQAYIRVSQGKVRVIGSFPQSAPIEVASGGRARLSPEGRPELIREDDLSLAAAPAAEPFKFLKGTLADIAAVFNERNHLPQFIVEGDACKRRVSAALNIDDPTSLIRMLEGYPDLTLIPMGESVVIRARGDTTPPRANASSCQSASAKITVRPRAA